MNMKKVIIICGILMSFLGLAHGNATNGDPNVSPDPNSPGTLPPNFPGITTHIYDANAIADGYVFLAVATEVEGVGYYLMMLENNGMPVWYKELPDDYAYDFKVQPNGLLTYAQFIHHHTYTGGGDVIHVVLDENFNEVETIQAGNGYVAEAHDFQILPNGNVLLIGYYMSEVDMSKIVSGGHPAALVSGAILQELNAARDIVFQWRTWDNYAFEDCSFRRAKGAVVSAFHFNTINQDYDGHLFTSGIRKINRTTGEIIWNLGGDENKFTFVGVDPEEALGHFSGHGFHRIPNGNVLNYDNGGRKGGGTSLVHEYALDEDSMVATHVWTYTPEPKVPAWHRGNAQRLPNGNTLIGWGGASGKSIPACTEVTPNGEKVFELYFDNPNVESYRAFRFIYPPQSQAIEVMKIELATGNTYTFADEDVDTGVTIKVNKRAGDGYNEVVVQREPYAPVYPLFPGKAPRVLPVRVHVSQFGITRINAMISFDVESFGFSEPNNVTVYHREFKGQGLFIPLLTNYNPVTKQLRATMTRFGEFIFCYPDLEDVSFAPMLIEPVSFQVQEYMVMAPPLAEPNQQYTVNQELPILLSWTPKGFARSYQLQVATDSEFNTLVVDEPYLTEARYVLEVVEPNTPYYWRVSTTNEGGTSEWSAGSFETVPPMVQVIVPNGGEKWKRGVEYFIQWDHNLSEDVVLELYKGDTLVAFIDTVPSTGTYEWEVGLNLESGSEYTIKVKSSVNETLFDISDNTFTIN